jgi:UPF0755 protein
MSDLYNKDVNQDKDFPFDKPGFERRVEVKMKNSKSKKKIIIPVILIIVLITVGVVGYFAYDQFIVIKDYQASQQIDEDIVITVDKGATASDVAKILVDQEVVKSEKAFTEIVVKSKATVQAGSFVLQKHMTAENALKALLNPDNLAIRKFTVPEGKTLIQTLPIITAGTKLSESDLQQSMDALADKLLPRGVTSFEGWLYPDSYQFDYDVTADDVIKAMVNNTYNVLKQFGVNDDDYEDVITKASIVQIEVKTPDMGKAARVIENRLKIDMKLAMDSIIGYGVTKGQGGAGLELKQSDLDDPNAPYNSRVQFGLPPTPISNPGADAINAVVNPPQGDWLYWVTVDPSTGETVFTETEADFNAARADYKSWCADNPEECGI